MQGAQRHLPGMPVPAPPYPGPPVDPNPRVFVGSPVFQNIQQPNLQQPNQQQPQIIQPVNNFLVVGQRPTDQSGQMWCPYCQKIVLTKVEYRNGNHAYMCCFILGMFFLWPFCLIPLCCMSCKDAEHYCPRCKNVLHIYKHP